MFQVHSHLMYECRARTVHTASTRSNNVVRYRKVTERKVRMKFKGLHAQKICLMLFRMQPHRKTQ